MWGFAADDAAERLCRAYADVLGALPKTCIIDGGIPAPAVTVIVAVALDVFARSRRHRR